MRKEDPTTPSVDDKTREQAQPQVEPTLHEVTATICSLCLDGAGGECHVPGCLFVFTDAPLPAATGPTMREKIVGVGSIDGVTTYPPLPPIIHGRTHHRTEGGV